MASKGTIPLRVDTIGLRPLVSALRQLRGRVAALQEIDRRLERVETRLQIHERHVQRTYQALGLLSESMLKLYGGEQLVQEFRRSLRARGLGTPRSLRHAGKMQQGRR